LSLFSTLSGFFTRAAQGRAEGERLNTPLAPVRYPDPGYIPMSWPLNYWQCGLNPLPEAPCSIVDACVWAYVRALAQLPGYHMEERDNGGRQTLSTTALSRILRVPNTYQTRSDFLTHGIRSLLYDGNWYSFAVRNSRQEVAELHWLKPDACKVIAVPLPGQQVHEVFYEITDGNPLLNIEEFEIEGRFIVPARNILHVKLMTPRHPLIGDTWLSCLWFDLANRGAMSAGMSTFFNNSSRPSGVITTDLSLDRTQVEELRTRWIAQTTGNNAGGTPILSHGLKWQQTGISQRDAQVVDALKLSDKQIAGVFGVPGILVGIDDGKPFASVEALMNFWLANGLNYLLDHIEVQIDQFFGLDSAAWRQWTEYDTDALLRTELATRIDSLVKGVQGGVYAPNEARAKEGFKSVKAGDEPRVQQQVVPLSFATDPPPKPEPAAPAIPPAPAPPAAGDQGEEGDNADTGKLFDLIARAKCLEAYEQIRDRLAA
jgi:HK97 family phage portal protein